MELLVRRDQQAKASSGDIWKDIAKSVDGMDFGIYVQLINDLWEGQGKKDPPGNTLLRIWYIALRKLTAEQLAKAILVYLETRADEYCTPKLLLELGGATTDSDAASVAAWDEVLLEIKRVGAYQTPRFSDSRTAATIKHLGGWVIVCDTLPEELHKWTRQHFLKTFAVMKPTAQARLTNLIEIENARSGMTEAANQIQRRIAADQASRVGTLTITQEQ